MIVFERLGGWGLGNSLFQIATTVSIAKHNKTNYAFPDNCSLRFSRYNPDKLSPCYFKHELPWINFEEIVKQEHEFWGSGNVGFKPFPTTNKLLLIDGFFQTEKYFKSYRNDILELYKLKEEYNDYLEKKYKHLIEDDSCVLHVRRGDYATARELTILDLDYYKQATEIIGRGKHYIIFSDDINWCKINFDFLSQKTFIEEQNDLFEMHLMSKFKAHIIANSTFSWWGAWMSESLQVIMPNPKTKWFSETYYLEKQKYNDNYGDLVATNWDVI